MRLFDGFGLAWSPRRLGRSLPVYRRLWVSRGVVAAVALLGLLAAMSCARRAAWAGVDAEPLSAAEAEPLARDAVARVDLPHWAPGEELPPGERPDPMPPPLPPPWSGPAVTGGLSGEALDLHQRGLAAWAEGDPIGAAGLLEAAAQAAPAAWQPKYHAALALYAAGERPGAVEHLDRADRLLRNQVRTLPAVAAAEAVTLSALAAVAVEDDCLLAVNAARRAMAALERYRRAAATAYDRAVPFPLPEAGIDSLHLWRRLADSYRRCDRPYSEYQRWMRGRGGDAAPFRATEYPAVTAEVRQGPFPAQLAACIEADDPRLPCWALSNLNRVDARVRLLYPREGAEAVPLARQHAEGLAALAFDVAWLAAQHEDDAAHATERLRRAAQLPLPADSPAAARIGALARHLAPGTGDYSFLAAEWRGRPAGELELVPGQAPEDVKGIAWAVSEAWIGRARAGRPDELVAAAEAWRPRAGPYGESLGAWLGEVRQRWRRALAAEVRHRRDNGDLAAARGLYELDGGWLGEEWPPLVAALGPSTLALWVGIGLGWLAAVAAAWQVHRRVVVPYLLYTTDVYREEYRRRERRAVRQGRPFTRKQILDDKRLQES